MRVAIGLLVLGLVCHLGSAGLTWHYLEKRAPGLLQRSADLPPGPDGKRLWEFTAGKGFVPRWVSVIGLLAVPSFLLGVVLLLLEWAR